MINAIKGRYTVIISVIGILVLPFFLMPSFFTIIVYLLVALLADIAYRPNSRILSSLLLPVLSSGLAFTLNTLNLDLASKKLQTCTLIALITLLFSNNKIYKKNHLNIKPDLINFFKFSILPVGVFLMTFVICGISILNRFMGGDSRNTSLTIKNILKNGYITPEQQSNYPSNYLFLNATVVETLESSATIHRYLLALLIVFVFCFFLILVSLGNLAEYLTLGRFQSSILSLFVLTPPILGFVIVNGFWTALWAIVLLISFFTNVFIFFGKKIIPPRSFLLVFVILSYHAWALLPPLLILVTLYCEYLRVKNKSASINIRDLIWPTLLLLYTFLSTLTNYPSNVSPIDVVVADGGIQSLSIAFLFLVFLLSFFLIRDNSEFKAVFWIVGSFLVISYLIIGSLRLPNTFAGYYNIKLFWIVYFSFVPILLAILFVKFSKDHFFFSKIYITTVFLLVANVSGLSLSSSLSILTKEEGLRIETIQILSSLSDSTPAIFWQFDDPPKDRVASFWSSFISNGASDRIYFNQIAVWAYSQTGREEDLCNVVRLEPSLTIFTRYPDSVKEVLTRMCPAESLGVIVR